MNMGHLHSLRLLAALFCTALFYTRAASDKTCNQLDSCSCEMSDGTGMVNLNSLSADGSAAFQVTSDGWLYQYNPCDPFTYSIFTDAAIVQSNDMFSYELGAQSSATFSYAESDGLALHYVATDTIRSSRVLLVCEPTFNVQKFEYIGELVVLEYDFILTTPCACPGLCNDNGLLNPLPTLPPTVSEPTPRSCTFVDYCKCDMTDGSGTVNLHSLAEKGVLLADSAFTVQGSDGQYYKYNPCEGFRYGSFSDLALLQTDEFETYGFDLGVQNTADFNFTEASGLAIQYMAANRERKSRVLLVCETANDHKFEFVGELVVTEYDFILKSPCACPGYCDDDGIIGPVATKPPIVTPISSCNFVDSCTCDMDDGTGQINLHSLAASGLYLTEGAFTVVGLDGWGYEYNPCDGFSKYAYENLAMIQNSLDSYYGFDLGVQSSAFFNDTGGSGLSIHYTAAGGDRSSRVILICDPVDQHKFEFIGELVITEYDFMLTTPCACPGYCDSSGIIMPVASPPPTQGPGVSCSFVDSCTCEMSDGSGKVNLHSLASSGLSLYDVAFDIQASDGWRYKYNPCIGFTDMYYYNYDLAIYQMDQWSTYGYDIGVQSTATFKITLESGLALHYTSQYEYSKSRVLLVCEEINLNEHRFEYVGLLAYEEYDFILVSPCACPGKCDNNGVISGGATPSTGGGVTDGGNGNGGGTNGNGGGTSGNGGNGGGSGNVNVNMNHDNNDSIFWTNVGATMLALIFHDFLLVIVIASIVILGKHFAWFSSNDAAASAASLVHVNGGDSVSFSRA